jgi:hypothetical protein
MNLAVLLKKRGIPHRFSSNHEIFKMLKSSFPIYLDAPEKAQESLLKLVEQCGLNIVTTLPAGPHLRWQKEGMMWLKNLCFELYFPPFKPMTLDLSSVLHESIKELKNSLLNKAMGSNCESICDATMGWGADTKRFLTLGKKVTALEMNPILQFLFYANGKNNEHPNLIFYPLNALDFLAKNPLAFDVVYLDPMYRLDKIKNKAKPSKEMQILAALTNEILSGQEDGHIVQADENLWSGAMSSALQRVVVKRPINGQWLAEKRPNTQFSSKAVRFDVYLK